MNGTHEKDNERTTKTKSERFTFHKSWYYIQLITLEAIQVYFFQDNKDKMDSFWYGEGRIIRGNQKRGHIYRNKPS